MAWKTIIPTVKAAVLGLTFMLIASADAQDEKVNRLEKSINVLTRELKDATDRLKALEARQGDGAKLIPAASVTAIRAEFSTLLIAPSRSGLDYGIADPDGGGVPRGRTVELGLNETGGYEVGVFGSAPALPFELGLRVYGQNDTWRKMTTPNPGGSFWNTRVHPNSSVDDQVTSAYAKFTLDYQVTDVEIQALHSYSKH